MAQNYLIESWLLKQSKRPVPANPTLKDPKDFTDHWKIFSSPGYSLKVNGEAQFGIDAEVPGMLYASIERSPVLLGKFGKL